MKKNASNFSKLALGVMVAASIAACNQKTNKSTPATTSSPAPTVAVDNNARIVFVNEDSIYNSYQYVKDMNARLESKGKAAQQDVGSRQQALQREYAELQKQAATMTPDQQKAAGERLQREGQTFQQYQQNASAEFQNAQMSEQSKLYEKISSFMKDYAKEKGYKMVLSYKKGATTVLYGDPTLDVTSDVVKRLNDAYTKDKK